MSSLWNDVGHFYLFNKSVISKWSFSIHCFVLFLKITSHKMDITICTFSDVDSEVGYMDSEVGYCRWEDRNGSKGGGGEEDVNSVYI